MKSPAAIIILAAGEGTRMKSELPKVLHGICGRTLVGHSLVAARGAAPSHLAVVVRHQRDKVAAHIAQVDPEAVIADQDEIKGTGRAVECGLDSLPGDLSGTVVVTMGDSPLLTSETISLLTQTHDGAQASVTVITSVLPNPASYGRIVRNEAGEVEKIVEFKDASEAERAINEVNSGIYAFDAALLREALPKLTTENAQGEKYLTDVIGLARSQGRRVVAMPLDDVWQTEGVNDRVQLATLGGILNRRLCEQHMRNGVTIVDPASTWIDADVSIGQDTLIRPDTQLLGATTIGAGCIIGPEVTITDSEVGDGAHIRRAEVDTALVGPKATVGPFSYLRPGTELGEGGKIGGFVETKNAKIGAGAKVPHLTYCGDAVIGEGANIGAGTIFANYDGQTKGTTTVGRHSFVGSNSVLVAPVSIADGAYIAAGSAVTEDVSPGQIAIARGQQRNVDGWVDRARAGTPTAAAAKSASNGEDPRP